MRNKSMYPDNWNDEVRPAILARDGKKCQHCGVKHRSYIYIDQQDKVIMVDREEHEELKNGGYRTYRVYLQVAHLNNDKSDCRDENLLSLCPRCHLSNDRQYKNLMRLTNG